MNQSERYKNDPESFTKAILLGRVLFLVSMCVTIWCKPVVGYLLKANRNKVFDPMPTESAKSILYLASGW